MLHVREPQEGPCEVTLLSTHPFPAASVLWAINWSNGPTKALRHTFTGFDLAQSRQMEETWRDAYVSSRAARAGGEGEPSPPTSVNEAIARAGQSFPNRLVVALNSKLDKNSPFRKPQEAFDALGWRRSTIRDGLTPAGRPLSTRS